jgi:hypothetical protein
MLSYSVGYSDDKSHDSRAVVMAFALLIKWGYVDLNHGPLPYQGSALTV